MSDGIAKHDWRELRKKLLEDIKKHRAKAIKPRKEVKIREFKYPNAPKTHYFRQGRILCRGYNADLHCTTLDRDEVDCTHCRLKMRFL